LVTEKGQMVPKESIRDSLGTLKNCKRKIDLLSKLCQKAKKKALLRKMLQAKAGEEGKNITCIIFTSRGPSIREGPGSIASEWRYEHSEFF
jgi:hypothetical protein